MKLWRFIKLLFMPKMLYELTGVVRVAGLRIRYWHESRTPWGQAESDIHARVTKCVADLLDRSVASKDQIAWSLCNKLKLNAVEVVADNDKASGVVLYRGWP